MAELKVGDIVARKSYGYDVLFKVVQIEKDVQSNRNVVTLRGLNYRIEADAPEYDLEIQSEQRVNADCRSFEDIAERKLREVLRTASASRSYRKKYSYRDTPNDATRFVKSAKVLHIDGDSEYLQTCINQYKKMGINVVGVNIPERDQPQALQRLLQEHNPDILVLTGHDGYTKGDGSYNNLSNYRNSKYYIAAVKEARKIQPDMDSLVIFAGACQSMYGEIIKAGANYASAPKRVLIHALDPVYVCQKVATTYIDKVLEPSTVVRATITGMKGIGGVQTYGKCRDGYPYEMI